VRAARRARNPAPGDARHVLGATCRRPAADRLRAARPLVVEAFRYGADPLEATEALVARGVIVAPAPAADATDPRDDTAWSAAVGGALARAPRGLFAPARMGRLLTSYARQPPVPAAPVAREGGSDDEDDDDRPRADAAPAPAARDAHRRPVALAAAFFAHVDFSRDSLGAALRRALSLARTPDSASALSFLLKRVAAALVAAKRAAADAAALPADPAQAAVAAAALDAAALPPALAWLGAVPAPARWPLLCLGRAPDAEDAAFLALYSGIVLHTDQRARALRPEQRTTRAVFVARNAALPMLASIPAVVFEELFDDVAARPLPVTDAAAAEAAAGPAAAPAAHGWTTAVSAVATSLADGAGRLWRAFVSAI
jgi:hypothetical protein